ncbi:MULTISPECIES: YkvA family protein [unclassified Streptomyces]|uniref:YkvA family protein n=1 Tax=unclassified Streptomyces TaxID=2593676 RepID=UPI002E10476B|nr:YkvA family protein [Streptomyces sp. NBC_01197]WSS51449.1 YkvA family protein [Streptomyces sp. NBC_01180]
MDFHPKALLAVVALALLAMLAVTVALAVRLFRARRFLREAGIPLQNKLAFWGALIYTISPVDLLPDPVYLDDIGVLLLALHSLERAARRGVPRKQPGHPEDKFGTVGPPAQ